MNCFAIRPKNSLKKRCDVEIDVFFSRRKLLHIGFEKPLAHYEFFEEMLEYLESLWKNPINFAEGYELIFPRPTN